LFSILSSLFILHFSFHFFCFCAIPLISHAFRWAFFFTEELRAELAEEEEEARGEDDEGGKGGSGDDDDGNNDDAPLYNPLNLPLGWDGKPIPYWLYKLHGLGIEYKCEVKGGLRCKRGVEVLSGSVVCVRDRRGEGGIMKRISCAFFLSQFLSSPSFFPSHN
jgi:hypothetical protein